MTQSKKKTLLSVFMVLALIVPAMFLLTACGSSGHKASSVWSSDETSHWHVCEICNEEIDKGPHVYDKAVVAEQYLATAPATYYYSCICGRKGTTTFVDENSKATATLVINDLNKTYDHQDITNIYTTNSDATATVEFKVKDADDSTYSTAMPYNAGEYTVRVTLPSSNNYKSISQTKNFTISKKTLTVVGLKVQPEKVYDGSADANILIDHYSFEGVATVDEDYISENEYTTATFANKNVEYDPDTKEVLNKTVTINFNIPSDAQNNYIINPITIEAKITPRPINGTLNITKTYNGKADFCAQSWITGQNTAIYYNEDFVDMVVSGDQVSLKIMSTSKDVGSTFKSCSIENLCDGQNYIVGDELEITVTTNPKEMIFGLDDISKDYDGTATYTYNFTSDDGLCWISTMGVYDSCSLSFTVVDHDGDELKEAGTYDSIVGKEIVVSNNNYKIVYQSNIVGESSDGQGTSLTINKKKLSGFTVTSNYQSSKAYAIALSTTEGIIEGDTVTLNVSDVNSVIESAGALKHLIVQTADSSTNQVQFVSLTGASANNYEIDFTTETYLKINSSLDDKA